MNNKNLTPEKLSEIIDTIKAYEKILSKLENPDIRLEEIQRLNEKELWDVVVSYLVENSNQKVSALDSLTPKFKFHRIYKNLLIGNDNEVLEMKVYEK